MNKISVLSFLLAVPLAAALDNGFGRTPVMGYNTYNAAACTINQTFVRDTINSFDSAGFRALGYTLFGLDCGWQGQQRQSNGSIDYDHSGFPDGIKPLSSLAISKGFVGHAPSYSRFRIRADLARLGACTPTKENGPVILQARSGQAHWAMSDKMPCSSRDGTPNILRCLCIPTD